MNEANIQDAITRCVWCLDSAKETLSTLKINDVYDALEEARSIEDMIKSSLYYVYDLKQELMKAFEDRG